jgi:hypothetical protein
VAGWYYLVAQLPSIPQAPAPLPITSGAFEELCSRFFDPGSLAVLRGISLEPPAHPAPTGSFVVDSWNGMENSLRFALAQVRAQKLKRDFSAGAVQIHPEAAQAARTAAAMDNPLGAERFLNDFRSDFISRITPVDIFSTEAVYAYFLRLKLAERARKFNDEAGMASYRILYDQILGDAK